MQHPHSLAPWAPLSPGPPGPPGAFFGHLNGYVGREERLPARRALAVVWQDGEAIAFGARAALHSALEILGLSTEVEIVEMSAGRAAILTSPRAAPLLLLSGALGVGVRVEIIPPLGSAAAPDSQPGGSDRAAALQPEPAAGTLPPRPPPLPIQPAAATAASQEQQAQEQHERHRQRKRQQPKQQRQQQHPEVAPPPPPGRPGQRQPEVAVSPPPPPPPCKPNKPGTQPPCRNVSRQQGAPRVLVVNRGAAATTRKEHGKQMRPEQRKEVHERDSREATRVLQAEAAERRAHQAEAARKAEQEAVERAAAKAARKAAKQQRQQTAKRTREAEARVAAEADAAKHAAAEAACEARRCAAAAVAGALARATTEGPAKTAGPSLGPPLPAAASQPPAPAAEGQEEARAAAIPAAGSQDDPPAEAFLVESQASGQEGPGRERVEAEMEAEEARAEAEAGEMRAEVEAGEAEAGGTGARMAGAEVADEAEGTPMPTRHGPVSPIPFPLLASPFPLSAQLAVPMSVDGALAPETAASITTALNSLTIGSPQGPASPRAAAGPSAGQPTAITAAVAAVAAAAAAAAQGTEATPAAVAAAAAAAAASFVGGNNTQPPSNDELSPIALQHWREGRPLPFCPPVSSLSEEQMAEQGSVVRAIIAVDYRDGICYGRVVWDDSWLRLEELAGPQLAELQQRLTAQGVAMDLEQIAQQQLAVAEQEEEEQHAAEVAAARQRSQRQQGSAAAHTSGC